MEDEPTPSASNVQRLKAAYQAWHDSKGAQTQAWLELMGDEVQLRSTGDPDIKELAFTKPRHSKAEVANYLSGLLKEWSMVYWTPQRFVADADAVAVFGRCAWTSKATGKTAEVDIAHLWTFEGGKVIEFKEVFDTARAVAAAAP